MKLEVGLISKVSLKTFTKRLEKLKIDLANTSYHQDRYFAETCSSSEDERNIEKIRTAKWSTFVKIQN